MPYPRAASSRRPAAASSAALALSPSHGLYTFIDCPQTLLIYVLFLIVLLRHPVFVGSPARPSHCGGDGGRQPYGWLVSTKSSPVHMVDSCDIHAIVMQTHTGRRWIVTEARMDDA